MKKTIQVVSLWMICFTFLFSLGGELAAAVDGGEDEVFPFEELEMEDNFSASSSTSSVTSETFDTIENDESPMELSSLSKKLQIDIEQWQLAEDKVFQDGEFLDVPEVIDPLNQLITTLESLGNLYLSKGHLANARHVFEIACPLLELMRPTLPENLLANFSPTSSNQPEVDSGIDSASLQFQHRLRKCLQSLKGAYVETELFSESFSDDLTGFFEQFRSLQNPSFRARSEIELRRLLKGLVAVVDTVEFSTLKNQVLSHISSFANAYLVKYDGKPSRLIEVFESVYSSLPSNIPKKVTVKYRDFLDECLDAALEALWEYNVSDRMPRPANGVGSKMSPSCGDDSFSEYHSSPPSHSPVLGSAPAPGEFLPSVFHPVEDQSLVIGEDSSEESGVGNLFDVALDCIVHDEYCSESLSKLRGDNVDEVHVSNSANNCRMEAGSGDDSSNIHSLASESNDEVAQSQVDLTNKKSGHKKRKRYRSGSNEMVSSDDAADSLARFSFDSDENGSGLGSGETARESIKAGGLLPRGQYNRRPVSIVPNVTANSPPPALQMNLVFWQWVRMQAPQPTPLASVKVEPPSPAAADNSNGNTASNSQNNRNEMRMNSEAAGVLFESSTTAGQNTAPRAAVSNVRANSTAVIALVLFLLALCIGVIYLNYSYQSSSSLRRKPKRTPKRSLSQQVEDFFRYLLRVSEEIVYPFLVYLAKQLCSLAVTTFSMSLEYLKRRVSSTREDISTAQPNQQSEKSGKQHGLSSHMCNNKKMPDVTESSGVINSHKSSKLKNVTNAEESSDNKVTVTKSKKVPAPVVENTTSSKVDVTAEVKGQVDEEVTKSVAKATNPPTQSLVVNDINNGPKKRRNSASNRPTPSPEESSSTDTKFTVAPSTRTTTTAADTSTKVVPSKTETVSKNIETSSVPPVPPMSSTAKRGKALVAASTSSQSSSDAKPKKPTAASKQKPTGDGLKKASPKSVVQSSSATSVTDSKVPEKKVSESKVPVAAPTREPAKESQVKSMIKEPPIKQPESTTSERTNARTSGPLATSSGGKSEVKVVSSPSSAARQASMDSYEELDSHIKGTTVDSISVDDDDKIPPQGDFGKDSHQSQNSNPVHGPIRKNNDTKMSSKIPYPSRLSLSSTSSVPIAPDISPHSSLRIAPGISAGFLSSHTTPTSSAYSAAGSSSMSSKMSPVGSSTFTKMSPKSSVSTMIPELEKAPTEIAPGLSMTSFSSLGGRSQAKTDHNPHGSYYNKRERGSSLGSGDGSFGNGVCSPNQVGLEDSSGVSWALEKGVGGSNSADSSVREIFNTAFGPLFSQASSSSSSQAAFDQSKHVLDVGGRDQPVDDILGNDFFSDLKGDSPAFCSSKFASSPPGMNDKGISFLQSKSSTSYGMGGLGALGEHRDIGPRDSQSSIAGRDLGLDFGLFGNSFGEGGTQRHVDEDGFWMEKNRGNHTLLRSSLLQQVGEYDSLDGHLFGLDLGGVKPREGGVEGPHYHRPFDLDENDEDETEKFDDLLPPPCQWLEMDESLSGVDMTLGGPSLSRTAAPPGFSSSVKSPQREESHVFPTEGRRESDGEGKSSPRTDHLSEESRVITLSFSVRCEHDYHHPMHVSLVRMASSLFGRWQLSRSLPMHQSVEDSSVWCVNVEVPSSLSVFSFKYLILDTDGNTWVEQGGPVVINLARLLEENKVTGSGDKVFLEQDDVLKSYVAAPSGPYLFGNND